MKLLELEEMHKGMLITVIGPKTKPEPPEDGESLRTPEGLVGVIRRLDFNTVVGEQMAAQNKGRPYEIVMLQSPFIAVRCPCERCKNGGHAEPIDTRDFDLMEVDKEYAELCTRYRHVAREEVPWWRRLLSRLRRPS